MHERCSRKMHQFVNNECSIHLRKSNIIILCTECKNILKICCLLLNNCLRSLQNRSDRSYANMIALTIMSSSLQLKCIFYFQFGEDGIIKAAFECINTTSRYYVEFGVQDGSECHSRLLREKGWKGKSLSSGGREYLEI